MHLHRNGEGGTAEALQDEIHNATDFDIELRCPICHGKVDDLDCAQCGFHLRTDRGIVRALAPHRILHYAQFIEDYQRIRKAEGRGSESDEYYLNLPYCDVTGSNSGQWQIRARSFVCLMEKLIAPAMPAGARILDLGSGNCWLSFRLAATGYSPTAVDILTNDNDGLGAAEHYRGHLRTLFPRFCAELGNLPFQDGQFNGAIFNASFHYAEDDEAALREALRCVADGGFVAICDTPWYSKDRSGRQMVEERRAHFMQQYGTDSASLRSIEYLTDRRLKHLEERLSIRWTRYLPSYGLPWALRPLVARFRGRREPARFRIYVAQKVAP